MEENTEENKNSDQEAKVPTEAELQEIFKWLDVNGLGIAWNVNFNDHSRAALILGEKGLHFRIRINANDDVPGMGLQKLVDFRTSILKTAVFGVTMDRAIATYMLPPEVIEADRVKYPKYLYCLNILCMHGPINIPGVKQHDAKCLKATIWTWLHQNRVF